MKILKIFLLVIALPFSAIAQNNSPADHSAGGQIVWWGKDHFWKRTYTDHTNGLVEAGNDFLSNAISVAAMKGVALALKNDGMLFAFGLSSWPGVTDLPTGLNNIVSISSDGNRFWAIKGDGTVFTWGSLSTAEGDPKAVVARLTNITAIVQIGYQNYIARKKNGTLVEFSMNGIGTHDNDGAVTPVRLNGQILSDVFGIASAGSLGALVLKNDGSVFQLKNSGSISVSGPKAIGEYDMAIPYFINGVPLTNIVSIASRGMHIIAVKSDGTIMDNIFGSEEIPSGLKNVRSVAVSEKHGIALKLDGTITAWGDNHYGQTFIPAGLSNVVAIAAGDDFSLAVTTAKPPPAIFVQPHGIVETMERDADLVFKGRVVSCVAINNNSFPDWSEPHAAVFEIVSVLKGSIRTNRLTFLHITGAPLVWSGRTPPPSHNFEVGQSYLVFAVQAGKEDWLFKPEPNSFSKFDQFRQLMRNGGSSIRTIDDQPLENLTPKAAHWVELNRLINNSDITNQLYAINKLDEMSLAGRRSDEWANTCDFNRQSVLTAILPLVTNQNQQVACRAINCFETTTNAANALAPFADTLIRVAVFSPSSDCRLNAISALSGLHSEAVLNSLAQLMGDPDENIRLGAVRLLPRFPTKFAVQGLEQLADDKSANVRSVVADVIGDQKYAEALPILVKLFADPVGKDSLIKPLTLEFLEAGQRWNNIGDVHTSAGLALVKYSPDEVSHILRSNLNDAGFHINFVAKLAQKDAEPWLPESVSILEARYEYVEGVLKSPWNDPRRFADPQADRILIGAYTKCWEDIRQYLLKQTPEDLVSGRFDSYLDLLEKTVQSNQGGTVYPAKWLYELYATKQLVKRMTDLRQRYNSANSWWFDDFDKRGEAAQVDAITF
jgi:hypothetical protein